VLFEDLSNQAADRLCNTITWFPTFSFSYWSMSWKLWYGKPGRPGNNSIR